MPKVKIPRKSTNVDMTAMCDVAFLLLTFFILATKQKPPEVLAVKTPSSVSNKATPDKSILITMTAEGKVFLTLGDDTKKNDIIDNFVKAKNLQLSPTDIGKLRKADFIGFPANKLKSALESPTVITPDKMEGIPVKDSTSNELTDWMRAVTDAYKGTDQKDLEKMLLVKGDNNALYPVFKEVKMAFKKNQIFKFRIVTSSKDVPKGSELEREGGGKG